MGQKTLTLTGGNTNEMPRSATAAPNHVPSLPIQVNALQALCRQVFGFRLAMIALAAPFALARTAPGLATWLVGSAVLVTFMLSYVLLRDWERFGPVLLRHPVLLAVDMFFGALLLITASPDSTLAYVTICTPLLAGLVYGWRGAALFAVLQSLIVAAAYVVNSDADAGFNALLLPGLCVIAGAIGSTLRSLMLGFGTASHALTEARARLAVHGAVEEERARLAREMHDSVAKTLHGLAMAADGLAHSADRMDPLTVKHQAELVARSARRAAAESRELLSDLRRESGLDGGVDVLTELRSRTEDFARRRQRRGDLRADRRGVRTAHSARRRPARPDDRQRGDGERAPSRESDVCECLGRGGPRSAADQRVRRRERSAARHDPQRPAPGGPLRSGRHGRAGGVHRSADPDRQGPCREGHGGASGTAAHRSATYP